MKAGARDADGRGISVVAALLSVGFFCALMTGDEDEREHDVVSFLRLPR